MAGLAFTVAEDRGCDNVVLRSQVIEAHTRLAVQEVLENPRDLTS